MLAFRINKSLLTGFLIRPTSGLIAPMSVVPACRSLASSAKLLQMRGPGRPEAAAGPGDVPSGPAFVTDVDSFDDDVEAANIERAYVHRASFRGMITRFELQSFPLAIRSLGTGRPRKASQRCCPTPRLTMMVK